MADRSNLFERAGGTHESPALAKPLEMRWNPWQESRPAWRDQGDAAPPLPSVRYSASTTLPATTYSRRACGHWLAETAGLVCRFCPQHGLDVRYGGGGYWFLLNEQGCYVGSITVDSHGHFTVNAEWFLRQEATFTTLAGAIANATLVRREQVGT